MSQAQVGILLALTRPSYPTGVISLHETQQGRTRMFSVQLTQPTPGQIVATSSGHTAILNVKSVNSNQVCAVLQTTDEVGFPLIWQEFAFYLTPLSDNWVRVQQSRADVEVNFYLKVQGTQAWLTDLPPLSSSVLEPTIEESMTSMMVRAYLLNPTVSTSSVQVGYNNYSMGVYPQESGVNLQLSVDPPIVIYNLHQVGDVYQDQSGATYYLDDNQNIVVTRRTGAAIYTNAGLRKALVTPTVVLPWLPATH